MSNFKVAVSAELMENYIQSDFLLAQEKFLALQTDAGASLLFSIGTGGVFNLTMEGPGKTHGWQQIDLSSTQILSDFAGKARVKTFGAVQVPAQPGGSPAQIHLAMVVDDGTNNHLFLSLGNSDADLSWADKPLWTAAPFNAVDSTGKPIPAPSPLLIANLYIGEATDQLFIAADTIRNPEQEPNLLARYYIDNTSPSKIQWQAQDLAIDVEAAGCNACLGRAANAFRVDGLYTQGKIGSSAQLIYTPLFNAFDNSMPPLPSRLGLPGGLAGEAIAAVRNADNSSDLYVAAEGSLYWFASDNQEDGATGTLVATSPLLKTVGTLFASAADGYVVVWGLNSDNEVFYLACALGSQGQVNAWSRPLPILTNVDAIAPFLDRNYSAKTFFAQSETGLIKLVKSPTTGLWNRRNITLPPSVTTKAAEPIHSYTTHIKVTDENGQAAVNQPVTISASNVTSVYINHLYYLVGPSAIDLTTDALGSITIVETATSLTGTRFQVTVGAQPPLAVNTMDTAWNRNAAYTTSDSLQNAKIIDRNGNQRTFIPAGTAQNTVDGVAQSNKNLAKAYASLVPAPQPFMLRSPLAVATPPTQPVALAAAGFGDAILADIGDLFNWLASGVDSVIQLVEDAAAGIWHFVVTIGGAVYHATLDCIEAIMAAATWVYNAVKVAVDDVINFLEFVFGWQDILTTHKVLKNVVLRLSEDAIAGIDNTKAQIAAAFKALEGEINNWADIPSFDQTSAGLLTSSPSPSGLHSAPANLGVHHFQGHYASATSALPVANVIESLFDDLLKLLEAEGDTLAAAVKAIKTDIIDPFSTLTVTQIVKRIVVILTDTLLQSGENVLLTLINVFQQLLDGVIDTLTAVLDIPVLSWLYKDLTGEDLSFLDLVCLVAAIPVTIVYKIIANKTPFPEADAFTQGLIGAQRFSEIQSQFVMSAQEPGPIGRAPTTTEPAVLAEAKEPAVLDASKLQIFSLVTGIASSIGSMVLILLNNVQRARDAPKGPLDQAPVGPNDAAIRSKQMMMAVICAGNILYVSPNFANFETLLDPESKWYVSLNNALTGVSILKGLAAIAAASSQNPNVDKGFALAESCINYVWNVPVIANLIVNRDVAHTTYKSLIPESIGNFAFNYGGMLEFGIAMSPTRPAQLVLSAAQAALMLGYGICMIIAGAINQSGADQSQS